MILAATNGVIRSMRTRRSRLVVQEVVHDDLAMGQEHVEQAIGNYEAFDAADDLRLTLGDVNEARL